MKFQIMKTFILSIVCLTTSTASEYEIVQGLKQDLCILLKIHLPHLVLVQIFSNKAK